MRGYATTQPGVASVHCAILQKTLNSVSLYLRHYPQLEGHTYKQARRR